MNNLEFIRTEMGLSKKDIASLLNVTAHTYYGYEKERLEVPKPIWVMLSKIFDISIQELKTDLTLQSRDKIYFMKRMPLKMKINKMIFNLSGENLYRLNYNQISKIKEKIEIDLL